jgi:hypothetical protein
MARVDFFIARSAEGSKVKFTRKQTGVVKDNHFATRGLTDAQARKLYEDTADFFKAAAAKLKP